MAKMGRYYLLVLLIGVGVWRAYAHYRAQRVVHVQDAVFVLDCSPQYSLDFVHTLSGYTHKSNWASPELLAHELQQKFGLVARVQIIRKNGRVIMHIDPPVFKCVLNNDYVLDTDGRAHSCTSVDLETRKTLARLHAQKTQDLERAEFKEFVRSIPVDLMRDYTVTWSTPYDIVLDSHVPYKIRASYDHIPDLNLLRKAARAYAHARFKAPKKKFDEIDVRFEHQIIVGAHTGG